MTKNKSIEGIILKKLRVNTEQITYMPKDISPYDRNMGDKYLGRLSNVIHEWQFDSIANQIASDIKEKQGVLNDRK